MTNSPRDSNACFNWLIALCRAAELLALSMCSRSIFNAGSLSLMTHLRANTLASWRHVIQTVSAAPGKIWRRNNHSVASTFDHPTFSRQ